MAKNLTCLFFRKDTHKSLKLAKKIKMYEWNTLRDDISKVLILRVQIFFLATFIRKSYFLIQKMKEILLYYDLYFIIVSSKRFSRFGNTRNQSSHKITPRKSVFRVKTEYFRFSL